MKLDLHERVLSVLPLLHFAANNKELLSQEQRERAKVIAAWGRDSSDENEEFSQEMMETLLRVAEALMKGEVIEPKGDK